MQAGCGCLQREDPRHEPDPQLRFLPPFFLQEQRCEVGKRNLKAKCCELQSTCDCCRSGILQHVLVFFPPPYFFNARVLQALNSNCPITEHPQRRQWEQKSRKRNKRKSPNLNPGNSGLARNTNKGSNCYNMQAWNQSLKKHRNWEETKNHSTLKQNNRKKTPDFWLAVTWISICTSGIMGRDDVLMGLLFYHPKWRPAALMIKNKMQRGMFYLFIFLNTACIRQAT